MTAGVSLPSSFLNFQFQVCNAARLDFLEFACNYISEIVPAFALHTECSVHFLAFKFIHDAALSSLCWKAVEYS